MNKIVKPYIKQIETIGGFSVWIVNGNYIRNHIHKEFTNFGQHFRFKFIPENEFWIDKEYGEEETEYFIQHLLLEHKLMSEGRTYNYALKRASALELQKRTELRSINDDLKNLKKRRVKGYGKNSSVWIVNGKLVRDFMYIDFAEGGHDLIYPFIPKNEIWIDDDIGPREVKLIILHEVHERNMMCEMMLSSENGNWRECTPKNRTKIYCIAHRDASKIERFYRKKLKGISEKIKEEFKKYVVLE